jgi:predicted DNA binding CopG/RHH family protein
MKKSKLSELTNKDIEAITLKAARRKDIPLVKSEQVNMRIDPVHLQRIKELASQCGEKYTTFILNLLVEDIDRLWAVYKK